MLKFVVLIVALFCGGVGLAKKESKSKTSDTEVDINFGRYVVGGILGTTLGFGLGHIIQRRWGDSNGWFFTLSEFVTFFAMIDGNDEATIAFWLLRLAETVHVWIPYEHLKTKQMIPKRRYFIGGALGTIPGFGIGHLVQGRWLSDGWYHTVFQGLIMYEIVRSEVKTYPPCPKENDPGELDYHESKAPCGDDYVNKTGRTLLAILKLFEIISVWLPDTDRYRVPSASARESSKLNVLPLVLKNKLGLQLAYAF